MAWIRLPHLSNLTDCQPWWSDTGVQVHWTANPQELFDARVIVLPGSKNTLADLRWLRSSGMADAIMAASRRGVLVIGICGGFQMLGQTLQDEPGHAGDAGHEPGLALLPAETVFSPSKTLRQVSAKCGEHEWLAYEIHMGVTRAIADIQPLQMVKR